MTRARGFTLLEVLVAFLVLTLCLGVLLRIFSAGFNAVRVSERQQMALLLAQSRMTEVLAELSNDSGGEQHGRLQPPYSWQSSIEPFEFPNQEPGAPYAVRPLKVSVSVSWGERPAERVQLSTLRLVEAAR